MNYNDIYKGTFISRPNRFIANVDIDGKTVICHVKNTGRCRELLVPGCTVFLEKSKNPNRKTEFDLVSVIKNQTIINMDSQAPNLAFKEYAKTFDSDTLVIRPEYKYGHSRIDFCLEKKDCLHLVEVKGVTLEQDGHTYFPDAPTERGIKHLEELESAVFSGLDATIFFVVQMENAIDFSPNDITHKQFGLALRHAVYNGVEAVAFNCHVSETSMSIWHKIPINI